MFQSYRTHICSFLLHSTADLYEINNTCGTPCLASILALTNCFCTCIHLDLVTTSLYTLQFSSRLQHMLLEWCYGQYMLTGWYSVHSHPQKPFNPIFAAPFRIVLVEVEPNVSCVRSHPWWVVSPINTSARLHVRIKGVIVDGWVSCTVWQGRLVLLPIVSQLFLVFIRTIAGRREVFFAATFPLCEEIPLLIGTRALLC